MDQDSLALIFLVLIVIVIASVAALAFSAMFLEAVKTYQFMDAEKGMLEDSRYAEERVTRELKRVKNNTSSAGKKQRNQPTIAMTATMTEASMYWPRFSVENRFLSLTGSP